MDPYAIICFANCIVEPARIEDKSQTHFFFYCAIVTVGPLPQGCIPVVVVFLSRANLVHTSLHVFAKLPLSFPGPVRQSFNFPWGALICRVPFERFFFLSLTCVQAKRGDIAFVP